MARWVALLSLVLAACATRPLEAGGDVIAPGPPDAAAAPDAGASASPPDADAGPPPSGSMLTGGKIVVQCGFAFVPTVATGDLDGDGIVDLLCSGDGGIAWLRGSGGGHFAAPQMLSAATYVYHLVVVDLDGDGDLDVAAARPSSYSGSSDGDVVIVRNDGGAFVAQQLPAGNRPIGIAVADADRDGVPDLWVTNDYGRSLSFLRGLGNAGFAAPTTYALDDQSDAIVAGDFDGDGWAEALIGTPSSVKWATSGPSGLTVTTAATHDCWELNCLTVGDFDGDGRQDAAIITTGGNGDRTVGVFSLTGPAPFAVRGVSSPKVTVGRAVAAADMDGDGHVDLVHTGWNFNTGPGQLPAGQVYLLRNAGDGTFADSLIADNLPPDLGQVLLADVTGDGRLDVIVPDYAGRGVTILPSQ